MHDPLPPVRRVSFGDLAPAAAAKVVDDPGRHGLVAAEAGRLAPLHRMQVAFDQLAAHADGHRRGVPGPYESDFRGYVRAEMDGARRHAEVLRVGAAVADGLLEHWTAELANLEAAMSKKKDDDAPQLTTGGEPHPLTQGGYDPNADPQLPGNISDVEALKEGKTTRQQAEALAAADAEAERPPLPPGAEPAGTTPPPADDDDDARGKRGKSRK